MITTEYTIKTASKVAFLSLILTACVTFIYEVVLGRAVLTADNFMVLATAAATYYFTRKGFESKSPTS